MEDLGYSVVWYGLVAFDVKFAEDLYKCPLLFRLCVALLINRIEDLISIDFFPVL